jgi:NADP-dependent 3-hydroxy acid dehydrogenase YdfG
MNNSKVWLVIGAGEGLGAAATKYLVAKKQIVVALIISDCALDQFYDREPENLHTIIIEAFNIITIEETLENITAKYGWIDFIINNSNYQFFNRLKYEKYTQIKEEISANISTTIGMIKTLLPYLNKEPVGHIINIPPQLCFTTLPRWSNAGLLSLSMDLFLKNLHNELLNLDCRLSFLKPGERLPEDFDQR